MARYFTTTLLPRTWVFSSGTTSASCYHRFPLAGAHVPAMETGTAKLLLEHSEDPPSTADSAATWVKVNAAGTQVEIIGTTVAGREVFTPETKRGLRRTRLVADNGSGTPVAQVAQVVKPVYADQST